MRKTAQTREGFDPRLWERAFGGLVFLMVGTVLLLFRDFGITWDEPNQNQYGKYVLQYYETFCRDQAALNYLDAYLYGGLFDSIAALLVRLSPLEEFETRHLLNALVGVAGVAGTWKLTRLLADARAGILAALLLFLEPSYFGHMFNNPKDIPFAAGYVWSLAYLLESVGHFPRPPTRLVLKLGVAIGLTLGVRVGGFMLLAYLGLAALAYGAFPAWFCGEDTQAPRLGERLKGLAGSVAGIAAIAYAVMLASWPWAQQNPLIRPFQALVSMSRFGLEESGLVARVLLAGEYVHAKHLPASYLPHYFAVKLPELALAGAGCGALMAIWFVVRGNAGEERLPSVRYALLAAALSAPVVYAILHKAVLYDANRHFLFAVPLWCAVSGVALEKLFRILGGTVRWKRWAAGLVLVAALLPQTYALVRLHPHQYVYFNSLVGGVKGAQGRYELDYWGNSYKEAVEKLADWLTEGDRLQGGKVRVKVWGPVFSAAHYFPENFALAREGEEADFLITFTRWGFHEVAPGQRIAAVDRMGAVLSVVHDLRANRGAPDGGVQTMGLPRAP
jgi:hypothetical protein